MTAPPVTVVICARNAATLIPGAIQCAQSQVYGGDIKVLVVDNGSSDATAEVAKSLGATVVAHPIAGVAGARQVGWQAAESSIIAFLDSDCEPPSDWLARAVPHLLDDPQRVAVGAKLIEGELRTVAEIHVAAQGVLNTDFLWEGSERHLPFIVTAAMVVRREALIAVGGFDVSLGRAGGEDCDLCMRFREAGLSFDYRPDIRVVHHHRATVGAMLRQVYWYGQGSSAVVARWHHRLSWWARFNARPLLRIGRALVELPFVLVMERDRYRRLSPALRILDALAYMAGRITGAIRHRVACF